MVVWKEAMLHRYPDCVLQRADATLLSSLCVIEYTLDFILNLPSPPTSTSHTLPIHTYIVCPPHAVGAGDRCDCPLYPRLLHHHGIGGVLLLHPAGIHPPWHLPLETV